MNAAAPAREPFARRWWIYQRERFPLFSHGLLIGAFSASAVLYSALRRDEAALPDWPSFVVAFGLSLLFFLQLRIADEFKDFEDDSRYRPYRPVPRGLVSLRELLWLGVVAAAIQLALAWWLQPALLALVALCWLYLLLMSREFFVASWLKRHPLHYLWTHMLILPLIDFCVTGCDWLVAGAAPRGLQWLLAVSFLNGIVIELGRKMRAPVDEELGVETYSALYGRPRSVALWLGAMGCTGLCAWLAVRPVGFVVPVVTVLTLLLLGAVAVCYRYLRTEAPGTGRLVETMAGIWSIVMYLSIGLGPWLGRYVAG
jgi:4-hydroxybenzoate polyprenyltransferase